jgi:hypothetical protein
MIKSKINTLGYWITPFWICVFITILVFTIISDHLEKEKNTIFIFLGFFLFLTISQLFDTSKSVIINKLEKVILVKHYITRKAKKYSFSDLDGYADLIEKSARGKPFRVIYLVKNKEIVQELSGFIYSNIDEIEIELDNMKYLGRTKYSYFRNLKISFGGKALIDLNK